MISNKQTITPCKKYSYKEYNARWYRENKERHLVLQKKRLSHSIKYAAIKERVKKQALAERLKQVNAELITFTSVENETNKIKPLLPPINISTHNVNN